MVDYFNEIDPIACAVLRATQEDGYVDERSIKAVMPDDVSGYNHCHWFAGAGLWAVALAMAGWPSERPIWTASCPCQPFSVVGQGGGTADKRHLWPDLFRLIDACRPGIIVGEQVGGAAGYGWLDGVRNDLEGSGYACWAVDIPACAVNSPQKRNRIYWCAMADAKCLFGGRHAGNARSKTIESNRESWTKNGDSSRDSYDSCGDRNQNSSIIWQDAEWLECADGKARRAKPRIRLLVDGLAGRIDLWRLAGNSIVPQVAAEVLMALMETIDWRGLSKKEPMKYDDFGNII